MSDIIWKKQFLVAIGKKLNNEEIMPSGAGCRVWIPTLEVIPRAKYGKTDFYKCEYRNITFPKQMSRR